MKINQKVIDLFNNRILREEYSSRLYEEFSLLLANQGYENLSKLYKKYSKEELTHAKWAKDFLLAHGVKPMLQEIPSPECDCKTLADVFNETLKHEQLITEECSTLATELQSIYVPGYTLALKYCAEQIEELDKAQTLVDKLKTFGDNSQTYLLIEHIAEAWV